MSQTFSPFGVLIPLVVIDHRGRATLRPAERKLRRLANGALGVCLGKEVRQVRLVMMPGLNFPWALVDHRLPPRAEAVGWAGDASVADLEREMAKGVPALPAHHAAHLRVASMV